MTGPPCRSCGTSDDVHLDDQRCLGCALRETAPDLSEGDVAHFIAWVRTTAATNGGGPTTSPETNDEKGRSCSPGSWRT